ncbi:MAG TPA: GNAT family N-acetyltransferase [Thermoleophilaceae bacterium]
MRVRRAGPADAAAIAEIHVGAWRAGYRGLLPDAVLDGLSVGVRRRAWEERLAGADAPPTLVAEHEGAVAGFCALEPGGGEVAALYVDPGRWGSGAGAALLGAGLELLREHGAKEAVVWLLAGNERARRLYRRFGFAADGGEKRERIASLSAEEAPPQVRLRAPL